MPYVTIDPSRYDAESPITESLMTDIIGNIDAVEAIAEGTWAPLTGTGTYAIPTGVTKLRVIAVSGGGGGSGYVDITQTGTSIQGGGGGGGGGRVREFIYNPSPTEIADGVDYACGAGGAGGSGNNVSGSNGGDTTFGTETIFGGRCGRSMDYHQLVQFGRMLGGNNQDNGGEYPGGIGGDGYFNSEIDQFGSSQIYYKSTAENGGARGQCTGVAGVANVDIAGGPGILAGGGGGPLSLCFGFDGIEDYLGNGGDGGINTIGSYNGANATTYGAGGGGGCGLGSGGNGSAGVIFVQTLTV